MLLASQGDVALGDRDGLGVLALAVQLPHLGIECSKVIAALRLRSRPDARQQGRHAGQHDRAPQPPHPHRTPSPQSNSNRWCSVRGYCGRGKGQPLPEPQSCRRPSASTCPDDGEHPLHFGAFIVRFSQDILTQRWQICRQHKGNYARERSGSTGCTTTVGTSWPAPSGRARRPSLSPAGAPSSRRPHAASTWRDTGERSSASTPPTKPPTRRSAV